MYRYRCDVCRVEVAGYGHYYRYRIEVHADTDCYHYNLCDRCLKRAHQHIVDALDSHQPIRAPGSGRPLADDDH